LARSQRPRWPSFLFHNVVLLRYIEAESEIQRAINVLKMRDSDHEKGLRHYEIGAKALIVGEKLEGWPHRPVDEFVVRCALRQVRAGIAARSPPRSPGT
jgi:KaiC/GvpD/RAD55 family RecA-like ATPase